MSPRPKIGLELSFIIEAAGELADQQGIQEVTLANLAKKLGIRSPSLYNHFDGLPGLRKKLAIYGINMLYKVVADAAIGVSGTEAVLAVSQAYVDFARRHPGIYEATLLAPNPEDVDVQQAGAKIVDLSVRILQAYHLEGERALHAVRGLRSILHGFSSLEQKGGFKMSLDLNESLMIIIKAFLAGMEEGIN
ncbi:TetR/AcrR family transcriptional regulator [Neobacillus sp. MER 74]|uniref:TetR/AcrR family transcriptional regulator n=1 Tax=Bacillaceae TaxID=186817 RepID=UPI000BF514AF|nr:MULTISPECIES: TetR/AcrR family transcriptional regulator [Bacillaceae]MCM3117086.1 TetR/AcrR family transcriptional regulator [Neobacillus sp. MER 74]PFP24643.1 TetR family transcriptional regulator [Bacillus sp. AFS073361]